MLDEAETTIDQDIEALVSESAPIEESEEIQAEETAEQVESPELEAEEVTPDAQEKTESTESRDKRIAGYYAERARAQQLETELAELKQKQTQEVQSSKPAPEYDDFDTDAEYYAAVAKHEAGQAIEAYKAEESQSQANNSRLSAQQDFARKVAAANIPDYDVKANRLAETVGLRPDTLEALYELEGNEGPKMVAYLSEHLDIADGITPVQLGKLSAKLSAPKPVQQTKAPPVVKPVKGTSVTGKSLDDPEAEFGIDEVASIIANMPD